MTGRNKNVAQAGSCSRLSSIIRVRGRDAIKTSVDEAGEDAIKSGLGGSHENREREWI